MIRRTSRAACSRPATRVWASTSRTPAAAAASPHRAAPRPRCRRCRDAATCGPPRRCSGLARAARRLVVVRSRSKVSVGARGCSPAKARARCACRPRGRWRRASTSAGCRSRSVRGSLGAESGVAAQIEMQQRRRERWISIKGAVSAVFSRPSRLSVHDTLATAPGRPSGSRPRRERPVVRSRPVLTTRPRYRLTLAQGKRRIRPATAREPRPSLAMLQSWHTSRALPLDGLTRRLKIVGAPLQTAVAP